MGLQTHFEFLQITPCLANGGRKQALICHHLSFSGRSEHLMSLLVVRPKNFPPDIPIATKYFLTVPGCNQNIFGA